MFKFILSALAIVVVLLVAATSRSDVASSTPVAAEPEPTQATSPGEHEPFTPYDMGPAAISYESQTAEERVNIDRMRTRTEANQPPESVAAFARVSAAASTSAQLEITARQLGLVGADDQGVVP